ncbi:MAG TPA: hypothetical protein VJ124_16095 [Pyrinomonadaceae bacterium]|nr:hypothetical protein [Pyrinomonadaceae bacterium]
MKSTICRRVCREIEEAAPEQVLSDLSLKHLRSCSACQSFFDERLKMSELLGTLPPVVAPEDFDFRLRSRLAALKQSERRGFKPNLFGFNFPSAAIAMMLLLAGAAFLWGVYERPSNETPVEQEIASGKVSSEPLREVEPQPTNQQVEVNNNAAVVRAAPESRRGRSTSKSRGSDVASMKDVGRTVSRDFSSVPAPLLTSEQPVANKASVFPIEASYQALKLSLTDVNGVPRTISVPAVSFGSQRVLAGSGSSTAQNSARGDW